MGDTIVYQDVIEFEEDLDSQPIDVIQVMVEYEWDDWPIIASLSLPCATIGQAITINGANFGAVQGAGHVDFTGGGVAAVVAWADAQITVTVPAGTIGGEVTVTNNAGETSDGYAYMLCVDGAEETPALVVSVLGVGLSGIPPDLPLVG